MTWEHLEHVDLEGLRKGFINRPLWLGHHEIPVLQCWMLAFNFQLTWNSKKKESSKVKKQPFFCKVETFLCTKKDKEEMFQPFQNRIVKAFCSEKCFDCFDLFEHKRVLRCIFL